MTLQQLADRNRQESRLLTVEAAARRRPARRLRTGLDWIDYMLGGGFARGSVVMVHGEPGAGKSTLLAQAAGHVRSAAYVSGEEDVSQVAARFLRLGLEADLLGETDMAAALDAVQGAPLVIIDSIQVMRPGGVIATQLAVDYARARNVAIALVCHQNKEGGHSGARTIEHLIDVTIRLARNPRSITTEKNRYGPAGISLFLEMTEKGLRT